MLTTVRCISGHNSSVWVGSWAYQNPEALIDGGWRGIHFATVSAKEITSRYYGKPSSYNYFVGCSNGGRQGLIEAQRFPEDFDGILAGSPVSPFSKIVPWMLRQNLLFKPIDGESWVSDALWQEIHEEVVRQCDTIDGIKDGVIGEPQLCK